MKKPMCAGLLALVFIATLVFENDLARAAAPMISGTRGHTLAVDRTGSVYSWGLNGAGQLGDGTTNPSPTPIKIPGLSGGVNVAAGGSEGTIYSEFSFAVRSDGLAFAWGSNSDGQLGLGNTNTGPMVPTQIPTLTGVAAMSAGINFAAALKRDGTVWVWGHNDNGQLGKGDHFDSTVPLQVAGLSGIVKIAAGQRHMLALRADGAVFAWGNGQDGQLGTGDELERLVPVQVSGLPGNIVDIAAGNRSSWAAVADGTVYGWGENFFGELGDLTNSQQDLPVRALGFLPRIVRLANGSSQGQGISAHTFNGRLWIWGADRYAQVGDGDDNFLNEAVLEPQMLSGLLNRGVMFSSQAPQGHLVVANGNVRGWGFNFNGEVGTTTMPATEQIRPAPVFGVGATGQLNLGNYGGRKSNFNGGSTDGWLFWRYPSLGANTFWQVQGNAVVGNTAIQAVGPTWSVAGTGDVNGDGFADIVWVEAGGSIVVWLMSGTVRISSTVIGAVPAGWSLVAVGDVNGDGKDDLVFRSTGGVVAAWIMDSTSVRNVEIIGSMATNYQLAWMGDFDGNGIKDMLWFDPATGSAKMWELFQTTPINVWNLGTLGAGWVPAVVGDFNGDGRADILWRNGATNVIWYMTAGVAIKTQLMPTVDTSWQPVAVLDATGAGRDDIIWLNNGGSVVRWEMQGIDRTPNVAVIAVQGVGWQVVGQY